MLSEEVDELRTFIPAFSHEKKHEERSFGIEEGSLIVFALGRCEGDAVCLFEYEKSKRINERFSISIHGHCASSVSLFTKRMFASDTWH